MTAGTTVTSCCRYVPSPIASLYSTRPTVTTRISTWSSTRHGPSPTPGSVAIWSTNCRRCSTTKAATSSGASATRSTPSRSTSAGSSPTPRAGTCAGGGSTACGSERCVRFGKVIVRMLIFSAFILIAVSLLVFGATLLLPGDAARAILGQQATPERIAALNEQLGLDKPAWLRYLTWLGGLFVGDFGTSSASGGSVAELLGERIGASFILMGVAAVISVPLGIGLGVYQALHRGKRRDQAMTGISLVFAAM